MTDSGRPAASGAAQVRLSRSLVLVMATATGVAVANNYYAQALLPVIERDLHLKAVTAGLVVTVAQVGYALGLVAILPLGDLVERRRLVVGLSLATAAGLVWMGLANSAATLLPAAFVVGALTVLAQVLVPFAASLAAGFERGRVVGLVMSGLLIGILAARTVAGALAQVGTWRVVYLVAAAAMLALAAVLWVRLPDHRESAGMRYWALVRSVGGLLRREPLLRLRCAFGCLSFATFSVLWTSLAFLLAHRYHEPPAVIGLFGLAGAAGAAAAVAAGRVSDRGHARAATGAATALLAVSWVALWAGQRNLVWLVVGIMVLDVGAQGLHITNQSLIYRLDPAARSRITAAYMVLYFAGGAAGSSAAAAAYDRGGWGEVCVVGAAFALAALALWAATARGGQSSASVPPP